MNRKQALAKFQSELHVSYNQIFTYLTCSLKYKFQYVEACPMERVSIALPFGSAIHSAVERYYRGVKNTGNAESFEIIQEVFEDSLNTELEKRDVPIFYKKETPNKKSAIETGKSLLKVFYEGIDLTGFDIVAIEVPLMARLYTDDKQPTELILTGIIDLLLKDSKGKLIAVDHKTAKQPYTQDTVDDDLQMTSYAYLLASAKYVFPTADVHCRFDVMRKLKTPKFEQYYTIRTAGHRKRFAKVANAVLAGIDAGIFIPQPSWMCSDCSYADACKDW